jgi:Fur family ferric uptake transcriptional regulator
MSQKDLRIANLLKKNGLSLTRQRLAVFELLEDSEPLTMHELQQLAGDRLDRASLYRTVAVFEKLGIARRVNIGWKYKIELSDAFTEHHHHMTCLQCHKVIPINEQELELFINNLSAQYGFEPIEHQVEIQGYCADCRPKRTDLIEL